MSVSNPQGFHWVRRVEFCETDMAGIAHFSSFIIYMEQAEHAMLRALGTSVFGTPVSTDAGRGELQSEQRSASPTGQTFPPNHGSSIGSQAGYSNTSVLTWPRVHCECDYLAPARFEDELDIWVSVSRLGEKSVTYLHRMFSKGREVTTGKVVAVCSIADPQTGVLTGIRIPEHLRKLLSAYMTEAA